MTTSMRMTAKKRGFSLIESAIILGVVSMVIGGSWVATDMVRENLRTRKIVEGTLLISKQMQNLFSVTLQPATRTAVTNVPSILPADWATVNVTTSIYTQGSGATGFEVWLGNLPASVCKKVVAGILPRFNDRAELNSVGVQRVDGSWGFYYPPSSTPAAEIDCPKTGNTNSLYIVFNFVK